MRWLQIGLIVVLFVCVLAGGPVSLSASSGELTDKRDVGICQGDPYIYHRESHTLPDGRIGDYWVFLYWDSDEVWAEAKTRIFYSGTVDELIVSAAVYWDQDQGNWICRTYDWEWKYNVSYIWVQTLKLDIYDGYYKAYGSHSVHDDSWYDGCNHWTGQVYLSE